MNCQRKENFYKFYLMMFKNCTTSFTTSYPELMICPIWSHLQSWKTSSSSNSLTTLNLSAFSWLVFSTGQRLPPHCSNPSFKSFLTKLEIFRCVANWIDLLELEKLCDLNHSTALFPPSHNFPISLARIIDFKCISRSSIVMQRLLLHPRLIPALN